MGVVLAIFCIIASLVAEHLFQQPVIADEMYRSQDGLKVIITTLSAKIQKNRLVSLLELSFVFFLGMAIIIEMHGKILDLRQQLDKK